MAHNWDTLGMYPKKPSPRLATVDLGYFEPAVGFLGRYLKELGYDISEAWLEPYTERWFYYEHADPFRPEADSTFVIAIPHDVIETLNERLAKSLVKPTIGVRRGRTER